MSRKKGEQVPLPKAYPYPSDCKCAQCGRTLSNHRAETYHCAIGRAHRGFYTWSATDTFVPKLPKLRKDVQNIVTEFEHAVVDLVRTGDNAPMIATQFKLYATLAVLLEDQAKLLKVRDLLRSEEPFSL